VAFAAGSASLALFVVVERRARNPMMPLDLFRSRAFALANLLTLLLYAALALVLFLVPMDLIQIHQYTATAAGAALLPFPVIMFVLSRWSGGLVARYGPRLPLTIGPAVAAAGLALYARPGTGGAYWTTFFPAVVVLGVGMALTVAPLTATVMGAVDVRHAGVASGVNNAVARIAGLLAIAVFGVILARTFEAGVAPRLARLALAPEARAELDRELTRMAGADLTTTPSIAPERRPAVRDAIDNAFVAAFRVVMIGAAGLAFAAALFGSGIRARIGAARADSASR
jgi:predicted MFS family arabinose efflux permease